MSCKQCQERLSAYLDGELGKQETGEIKEHLRQCAECGERLRDMLALQRPFASLFLELPEQELLEQRVLQKLPERRAISVVPQVSWRIAGITGVGVLAVSLLLAFGPVWYPFLRILFEVFGQFLYVPLLLLADKPLWRWGMAVGAVIAVAALIRLLRAKPRDKEESS
ncbi:MAG TPA: zf-HC2 domain-containing protein [Patescibacteria group bacterium]|nr:zf-HC2 domain-containing protein [Patescibacteria group bacterium]